MVIRIKLPEGITLYSWIERCLAKKFNDPKPISLSKYISEKAACSILRLDSATLLELLVNTPALHAVILPDNSIKVHPTSFYTYVSTEYKNLLRQAVKKKVA